MAALAARGDLLAPGTHRGAAWFCCPGGLSRLGEGSPALGADDGHSR